jgi:Tol biopolymer transport system component
MLRMLWAALLVGCGSRTELDVNVTRSSSDAGTCDWTKTFTSVTPISEIARGAAELRLSRDELTGYFYRNADIFVTTRSSIGATFSPPVFAKDLSSPVFDADPFLSADGLSLFLNTNRTGTIGGSDIFVATRSSTASPFAPAVPVPNVSSVAYDGTPYVTNDGSELWLASNRDGMIHLFRAHVNGSGFDSAHAVTELNGPSSVENNPVLMADGLTIYFSSNRDGNTEIYVAHRDAMANAFSTPKIVKELSSGSDYASWISPDGCRLYMTRGAGDGFELWLASR